MKAKSNHIQAAKEILAEESQICNRGPELNQASI